MKLVHFSDLHLDTPFAWLARTPASARERRQSLRQALLNIVALATKEHADALLCGGDLFEHERVTPDTADFLRNTFASLDPIRVFLAPGNHDWYGPASIYSRANWPPNVHIFNSARLEPMELEPGLVLWGAAHCAPANTPNFLSEFRAPAAQRNLALFHGSERAWFAQQETGKEPHAAFSVPEIALAGLEFAFLGHFHTPKDADTYVYPGNPEPLSFGETGLRGAVVAEIAPGQPIRTRRERVSTTTVRDAELNLTGLTNQQQVRDGLLAAIGEGNGFVRVTLIGEVAAELDLRLAALAADAGPRVQLRAGQMRPAYDISLIATERTVRGQFVKDVQVAALDEETRRRVLITGLRALDGHADLEVP